MVLRNKASGEESSFPKGLVGMEQILVEKVHGLLAEFSLATDGDRIEVTPQLGVGPEQPIT